MVGSKSTDARHVMPRTRFWREQAVHDLTVSTLLLNVLPCGNVLYAMQLAVSSAHLYTSSSDADTKHLVQRQFPVTGNITARCVVCSPPCFAFTLCLQLQGYISSATYGNSCAFCRTAADCSKGKGSGTLWAGHNFVSCSIHLSLSVLFWNITVEITVRVTACWYKPDH